MTDQRLTMTVNDVQTRLPQLHEHLSRADSDRLDGILPLFRLADGTKANLAQCLDVVSPGKDRQKQQADFRQFRQHIRAAFDKDGLGIELTADTRKRTDAAGRECWFTGPPINRTAERIEQFSQSAAEREEIEPVEPMGLDTELIGLPVVRCCILAAADELTMAVTLRELLQTHFHAQRDFIYEVWDEKSVLAGENLAASRRAAVQNADIILQFASPSFLAYDELRSIAAASDTVAIPVLFKTIQKHQDRSCFDECEVFGLRTKKGGLKPFQTCRGPQREQFAGKLFEQIHQRLKDTDRTKQNPPRPKRPTIEDDDARRFTELFTANDPDDPIEPEGKRARFGEDVTRAAADTAGAVPMFAALDEWIRDPNAAVYAAILGESGIGKTTLLKTQTLNLIDARKHDPHLPLPIYIDLRLFSPTIQEQKTVPTNLVELLDEILERARHRGDVAGISGEDIVRMVQHESAILIFDGLDEKLVHLNEQQGIALMRVLWEALPYAVVRKQRRENAVRYGRLVFSCRSHYFKSLREQNALFLGEHREDLRPADYCAWVLLPFNERQVREYLRREIGEDRVEPTIELFRSVHNLEDLSGRPLLLSMMVPQIDALEQKRVHGEPVYGVTLYEMLVGKWLTRDAGKHYIRPEDKVTLMQNIAAAMWADGRREWDWTEVRDWMTRQIEQHELLKARYGKVDEVFEEDFRTATFVLRPGETMSRFRFAHTSLQEYFLACYLRDCLLHDNRAGWHLPLPSPETLEFLGQLIACEQPDKRRYNKCLQTLNHILGGEQGEEGRESLSDQFGSTTRPGSSEKDSRPFSPEPSAAVNAFHYWLQAIENDLPQPTPRHVNLSSANLYGLHIRGRSADQRLNLVGANFSGCSLRGGVRFENVDLTAADLSHVRAEFAEFLNTRATRATIDKANLTGTLWRRSECSQLDSVATAILPGTRWVDCRSDDATRQTGSMEGIEISGPPGQGNPARTGECLSTLAGHTGSVNSCAFSPDGARIVSAAHDKSLRLWDARTGECLSTLAGHTGSVNSCAFSPDGARIVSAAHDNSLRLWDARTGECLSTLAGHTGSVNSCAFSPDGARIVSAAHDNSLRLWDARTGECLSTLAGHTGSVNSCAFSPDGARIVSAAHDNSLRLWDARTGECLSTLAGHTGWVNSCAFSPDGARIVSAAHDNSLRLWDARTGECLSTLAGHTGWVNSCAFSPDGARIVSAAHDKSLRLWDARTGECLSTLAGHTGSVNSCAFSPDGARIVSAAHDKSLRLWDARTGECLSTLAGHTGAVTSCAFSPDGARIVSAADDKSLRLWDARTGECLSTLAGHTDWVNSCAFSPDGARIVSAAHDKSLRLWDARTGECLSTLAGHTGWVNSCAFSPDGARIVSAAHDKSLRLWDARTGECLSTLAGHTGAVTSCAFSPDGARIVSAAHDKSLRLWDARTGECLSTLAGHTDWVNSCAFSPDGARIVSAAHDKSLRLWDARTGECLSTLAGHTDAVTSCAFSPDGAQIVSAAHDNSLRLWDARTGECLSTLAGHTDWVNSCAFSPDGARIVSAAHDNSLRLWDARTGECPMTLLNGHDDQQVAVDFANNRILWASDEAWRLLRWRYTDKDTGEPRLLPAEHFGPLPTTPVTT